MPLYSLGLGGGAHGARREVAGLLPAEIVDVFRGDQAGHAAKPPLPGKAQGQPLHNLLVAAAAVVANHLDGAGDTPALTQKLKPGEDVLETALTLVEDLKLASGKTE